MTDIFVNQLPMNLADFAPNLPRANGPSLLEDGNGDGVQKRTGKIGKRVWIVKYELNALE